MRLGFGGALTIRAPERGESWVADLSVYADEGGACSVYLTASECSHLASWLNTMADVDAIAARKGEATGAIRRAEG